VEPGDERLVQARHADDHRNLTRVERAHELGPGQLGEGLGDLITGGLEGKVGASDGESAYTWPVPVVEAAASTGDERSGRAGPPGQDRLSIARR